jgi:HEPN domain-containing protein
MAREEIDALLKTARDQLTRAQHDLKAGFYDSCALFSALSAENSTSALILALGSKPSKRHRNWYVLRIIPKPKKLENIVNDILETLKPMEHHIIRARYPLKDENGKFIVPSEYYRKEAAEELLKNAEKLLEKTEKAIDGMFTRSKSRKSD